MPRNPDTSLPVGLNHVLLSEADAERCLVLSNGAGWNQSAVDWALMLDYGSGYGIETSESLIGTAVIVPYPPQIGWISMVIVAAEWRRKGLGTYLMKRCISACQNQNIVPSLDATKYGVPVYSSLGFTGGKSISRFAYRESQKDVKSPDNQRMNGTEIIEDGKEIIASDQKAFGTSRSTIIQSLVSRESGINLRIPDHAGNAGFVTGRRGRNYYHVGPLLASSDADASTLVQAVLSRFAGPLMIDVPDTHRGFQESLSQLGFKRQRSFLRMHLRDVHGVADPDKYYAIAGPEYG